MANDTRHELQRLKAELEAQNESLEAVFAECGDSAGIPLQQEALELLDDLCAFRPAPASPVVGTRC